MENVWYAVRGGSVLRYGTLHSGAAELTYREAVQFP